MAKQVVMPQMGESVAEGTIVRWLKKVGDAVERDEPLFEISTDKVDAEIPSPSAGVVSDVRVKEGETVPINTVVGVIDETAAKPATARNDGGKPVAAAPSPLQRREDPHPSHLRKGTVDTSGRFGPYAPIAPMRTAVAPRAPISTHRTCCTCCTGIAPHAPSAPAHPVWRSLVSRRGARAATVAGRAEDCARASHRRAQHRRQRRRRARDEERHPRLHRRGRSRLRTSGHGSRRSGAASPCTVRHCSHPTRRRPPGSIPRSTSARP